MRYKIPFNMFFKWFIPYSREGNLFTALAFPQLTILTFLIFPEWLYALVGTALVPWGAWKIFNYHRRGSTRDSTYVAVGAWTLWVFLSLAFTWFGAQSF